jgi:hypothetical protein
MSADGVKVSEQVNIGVQPPAPALNYGTTVLDSNQEFQHRMLVGTAATGLVRIEWVQGRVGQMIPCNWSMTTMWQALNSFIPLRYQVDDAQNLIVREFINGGYEWLLLWEHDVIPLPDALVRLNDYMLRKDTPIVSGLYYSRSRPSEPLMYRGRGTSYVSDWKPGDVVWCDGVPTGFLLIHGSLLRAMWNDAETYTVAGQTTRRVFHTPLNIYFDEATGTFSTLTGTSDLLWCMKVIEGDYLRKAGWSAFADEHGAYPFPVDTRIFCRHINNDGEQFP